MAEEEERRPEMRDLAGGAREDWRGPWKNLPARNVTLGGIIHSSIHPAFLL